MAQALAGMQRTDVAKGPEAFRTISEAADSLGVPQHVLRFWETKFSFIRPMKRAGGRRFYRPQDLEVLKGVRILLHDEGYTIKGVQRLHKEQGVRRLVAAANGEAAPSLTDSAPQPMIEAGEQVLSDAARFRLRGVLGDLEQVKARIDRLLAKR
jgi:DNA-binding transcriptional MerR regulator